MENEEISKKEVNKNEIRYFLTEAMGECCPEFFKRYGYHKQIDFFSPEGFFILWNWAIKQDWWHPQFAHWLVCDNGKQYTMIKLELINPEAFAVAIYNYLKESE